MTDNKEKYKVLRDCLSSISDVIDRINNRIDKLAQGNHNPGGDLVLLALYQAIVTLVGNTCYQFFDNKFATEERVYSISWRRAGQSSWQYLKYKDDMGLFQTYKFYDKGTAINHVKIHIGSVYYGSRVYSSPDCTCEFIVQENVRLGSQPSKVKTVAKINLD